MAQSTKTAKKEYKYKVATATVEMPGGIHKQIKAYGKSKREAESKLRAKIAEIERGEVFTNAKTPAMQYFTEWLQTSKKDGKRKVSEATYKDYAARLKNHLEPVFKNLALGTVQPAHCEQVLNRVNGASQSDINKTFLLLKSGFTAAVNTGLLQRSPMANLSRPKGQSGKRRSLTNEEYDRLRKAITAAMASPDQTTHAAAAFAAIALGCGCRPGEVAALRWSNIKLTGTPTLSVTGAVKKDTHVIGQPKTSAGRRSIGIPSWLVQVLSQYQQERSAILAAEDETVEFSLLFPDRQVLAWPASSVIRRKYWTIVREAANIPADVDLYCLRHTFCTRGAKAGVDLRTMRYLMGHESIEITSKIYTDITDDMKADASAAIEALERLEGDQKFIISLS